MLRRRTFKRYASILLLAVGGTAIAAGATSLLVPPPADRGVAVADVPFYQLPWGDNPFYPSNLQTTDGRFADPHNIPSAADCTRCHVREFEEWAASLHSVAGRDVVYDKTIDLNEDFRKASNGPEMVRFCESCHEPAELVLGRTNRVVSVEPSDAETEGLTCVVCHAAVAADPHAGNGALTLNVNEAKDHLHSTLIMASPRDHARAFGAKATNALITKSDFCGACHTEIYSPAISKVEGQVPVQSTYGEWEDSWYAERGVTCQDCHMNPDPVGFIAKLKRGVVEKPERYTHSFVGANYLMTETDLGSNLFYLRGGLLPGITGERYLEILKTQKALTHDFLRSAAALEILPVALQAGTEGRIEVAVRNVGAGHNLPTGVSDQKHMWLELEVTDDSGATLLHSGWFDEDQGNTDPAAVFWMERFRDPHGKVILDHLTFNTAAVDYTRPLIPPRGEDVVGYDLPVPAGAEGPVTVKARLWYRIALQTLVRRVTRTTIVVPRFLLAEAETTVTLDPAAATQ